MSAAGLCTDLLSYSAGHLRRDHRPALRPILSNQHHELFVLRAAPWAFDDLLFRLLIFKSPVVKLAVLATYG